MLDLEKVIGNFAAEDCIRRKIITSNLKEERQQEDFNPHLFLKIMNIKSNEFDIIKIYAYACVCIYIYIL